MSTLEVGVRCVLTKQVEAADTAKSMKSGNLEVLSTPKAIAFVEEASYRCVQDFMVEGQSTVGTAVNISHKAPTAVGSEVIVESELISIDRKKMVFSVIVYDEDQVVLEGTHTRFIVEPQAFMARLK